MGKHFDTKARREKTAQIVAAYVSHNSVGVSDLPGIISTVADSFAALGAAAEETSTAKREPVVPVRRSVGKNHLTCLVCGTKRKILKRHLATAHEITPSEYREMFTLQSDYPMTAPNYAKVRSELAKRIDLGSRKPTARRKKATPRKHAA